MINSELRKKIGQMLMFGFSGTDLNDSIRATIREQKVGGIILFAENILEPAQVRQMCQDLQQWNRQQGSEFALLMAIDQEGGTVSRIPWLAEQYPDPILLEEGSPEDAFGFGYGLGKELSNLGLIVDLAPVLDVLSNRKNKLLARRCLAKDAQRVAKLGEQLIRGLHAAGVLATGKHFPGHGDVSVDSHHHLPVSECSLDTLRQRELIPFVRAIQAGLEIIMTAHIKYPHLDALYPATLSKNIIQGLLREQLGFQGLVMTDDLNMKAITNHFSPEETVSLALEAGADILLLGHDPDQQTRIFEALMAGYADNRALIERASRRIIEFKAKWQKTFAFRRNPLR